MTESRGATRYTVDPDHEFAEALHEALKKVKDLTIPYTLISKSWFGGNKFIFKLKGPGQYVDLSDKYKKQKLKAVGFVYPILRRTGALEKSITDPTDKNAINLIINGTTLILGTKIEYGAAHQEGLGHMPKRPFILIGAEQTAPPEINKRRDAWIAIVEDHVMQVSAGFGKPRT